ncbi:MAG TPA: hypothetical protein VM487_04175 [Phycisphaerae bacterium]|nr:hypothetical protein [Phycisphaerae bacterium]
MKLRYWLCVMALAVWGSSCPPAAAAVKIGIAEAAADTGGGDQTIACSQSIGTPDAAMVFVTKCITLGTAANRAVMSMGITDGTNQRVVVARSDDTAVEFSDTGRRGATDEIIQIMSGASNLVGEANFKNWTTNGMTITWGQTPSEAHRIVVVFFAGLANAYVGDATSSATEDAEVDVTAPGFEPNQVIVLSNSEAFDDTHRERQRLSVGFVDNDGSATQASHNQVSGDYYDVSEVAALSHNDRVMRDMSPSTRLGAIEIGSFDSSGFSIFTRDAAFANPIAYLALQYTADDSLGHWVGSMDSPSVGDWSVTAPGFTPQFVLLLPSMCETNDTLETDGDGGVFGVGLFTASDEYSLCISDKDAAAVTVTRSLTEAKALKLLKHGGAATVFEGTFVSMDANGWTVDVDVSGVITATRFAALAVEADADAGAGGTLVNRQGRLVSLVNGGLISG